MPNFNNIEEYQDNLKTAFYLFISSRLGVKLVRDCHFGTTRNSIEATAVTVALITGGRKGYEIGSLIGTTFNPRIGGLIGGLLAGIIGSALLTLITNHCSTWILDYFKYEINEKFCLWEVHQYDHRAYLGFPKMFCPDCMKKAKMELNHLRDNEHLMD